VRFVHHSNRTPSIFPFDSFFTKIAAGFAKIEPLTNPSPLSSTRCPPPHNRIAMGESKAPNSTSSQEKTLYDRLGGDSFINILTCSFFDEIAENPDLKPFFRHISVAALKTHQVKLFRVIFGNGEEKPEEEDLLDFMLKTHTRLFLELGLDETRFDQVANCFIQGLQSFQVGQGIIDECVAILVPLRVVFEYGAQVAAKEKVMDATQLKSLPKASAKTSL
jgi:truncated hemoglobin YjbI